MTREEQILRDKLATLRYFWEDKGDIERYTEFEKLKPILQEKYPEVLKAWNDYKMSVKIMDAVMNNI